MKRVSLIALPGKSEFNRNYFCRVRTSGVNMLVSYDSLIEYFGDKFQLIWSRLIAAQSCKFVCRPVHGLELTFIAH